MGATLTVYATRFGDLDTSGNASGITARIDGYLRHREFG